MSDNSLSIPGEIVKKDNRLIRTRVRISGLEASRVLANLIACIRTDDTTLKEVYRVEAKHFLTDQGGEYYKRLKEVCEELSKATVYVEDVSTGDFRFRTFFTEIAYIKGKGIVEAKFNPLMSSYLLELRKLFTEYNLLDYLKLPSIYSQRMFEILNSLKGYTEYIMETEELHRLLNTPISFQNNFCLFRIRILEKAHRDITTLTKFKYEWKPIRTGHSIGKIKFIFKRGRKAIADAEKRKALEERRENLRNKRQMDALICAKDKGGDCRERTNKRLVCKVCEEEKLCQEIKKELSRDTAQQMLIPLFDIDECNKNKP